jgi:hypothetical protein
MGLLIQTMQPKEKSHEILFKSLPDKKSSPKAKASRTDLTNTLSVEVIDVPLIRFGSYLKFPGLYGAAVCRQ